MDDPIRNRIEESGLVQLDLAALLRERTLRNLDLAPQLWQGLAIREREFRNWLKGLDLAPFEGADVAVHCSTEAIVPEWVWMLVTSKLQGVASSVHDCAPAGLEAAVLHRIAEELDPTTFEGKRVVVKGCGLKSGAGPAMRIVERLQPVVKLLMFGEPCSTVPVYKSR
ncbi:MAG: hypothetical protein CL849_01850 [Crocinitomicaceae bacterium]|nr:hypothetical protein [Crocinitomicaceae bacterium]